MEARIALGAELDIASGKEISDGFDDLKDFLGSREKRVRARYLSLSGALAVTDPFTGFVEVGTPPAGRMWNILGLSVCGSDDNSLSGGGFIAFYVGDRPATGVPTLSQLRHPRLFLPSTETYSEKTQWCLSGQTMFFHLAAVTGLTQFVGNVWVAEYREDDVLDRSGR